jgi:hypothetical protein
MLSLGVEASLKGSMEVLLCFVMAAVGTEHGASGEKRELLKGDEAVRALQLKATIKW